MRGRTWRQGAIPVALGLGAAAAAAAAIAALGRVPARAQAPDTCSDGSGGFSFSGGSLAAMAAGTVTWDPADSRLKLSGTTELATFRSPVQIRSQASSIAVADLDRDGWPDLVGATDSDSWLMWIRNDTANAANLSTITWEDPTEVLEPRFSNCAPPVPAGCGVVTDYLNGATYDSSPGPHPDLTKGGRNVKLLLGGQFTDDNGDGRTDDADRADLLLLATTENAGYDEKPCIRRLYKGNGDGTFQTPYTAISDALHVGQTDWMSSALAAVDWDGDNDTDVVLVNSDSDATDPLAKVVLLLSTGGANPTFARPGAPGPPAPPALASVSGWVAAGTGQAITRRGGSAIGVGDFNGDGNKDVLVGSVGYNTLQYFPGTGGGLAAAQSKSFTGAATFLAVADFDGINGVDVVVGTDDWNFSAGNPLCDLSHDAPGDPACTDTNQGGQTLLYTNNGAASWGGGIGTGLAGPTTITSHQAHALPPTTNKFDWDTAVVINYDAPEDPFDTPDLIVADGNHSGNLWLFPNRPGKLYAECTCDENWTAWSSVVDEAAAAGRSIQFACIEPTGAATPAGTSVTWELSNESGLNPVTATSTSAHPGRFCADFPNPGHKLVWRARLCPSANRRKTPTLQSVSVEYFWQDRREHFLAGVTVDQGIKYVPSFFFPGLDGRLTAFSVVAGAPDTQLWEAGNKLEAQGEGARNVWTAVKQGIDCNSTMADWLAAPNWRMVEFAEGEANDQGLQFLLGACDEGGGAARRNATIAVIRWARGTMTGAQTSRFGTAATGWRKLGAPVHGQVAVLRPPPVPRWRVARPVVDCTLPGANDDELDWIDQFRETYKNRPQAVIAVDRGGTIRAISTNPASPADAANGRSVWEFIPPAVALQFDDDMADGLWDNYVDGSPLLVDVWDPSQSATNKYRTMLVVGLGHGGRAYLALDVTDTITSGSPSLKMCGGVPCLRLKWQIDSTDADFANLGQTLSHAAVVRTKACSGATPDIEFRFAFGSGRMPGQDVGDTLYLVRAHDGEPVWSRELFSGCGKTSIPGDPSSLDYRNALGFAAGGDGVTDFVAVGDTRGDVFKFEIDGDAVGSENVGGNYPALYSTAGDPAIGEQEPITAALALFIRPSDNKPTLIFGTGGLEGADQSGTFHTVSIDADTGDALFVQALDAGQKAFSNVVVGADGNCFVVASGSDVNAGGACHAAQSELLQIDCASGVQVGSAIALAGAVRAPLFARGGVLTVASDHGVTTIGSGTGQDATDLETGEECGGGFTCLVPRGQKEVW